MAKKYTIEDLSRLKRLSTIGKLYRPEHKPEGVSREYIRQLKEKYNFPTIEIDGMIFVDINDLPKEVKQYIKK